jgi:hypothetical protein
MPGNEPYFQMKLAEARDLFGDPHSDLISIKLRPTESPDSDVAAYAYASDYRDLNTYLKQFPRVAEGRVSGGEARVHSLDGTRFVIAEHETGPEMVVPARPDAALKAMLLALAREFARIVQKNDRAKKRHYRAGAISVEKRTEKGARQLFVIQLPASDRNLELQTKDFYLKVFGPAPSSRSRARKPSKPNEAAAAKAAAPSSRSRSRKRSTGKIVILFMGANPSNATQLALTREVREIDKYLRSTDLSRRFRLEQQWETQAHEFPGRIMRFKPTIVHFSGHGSRKGELVFHDQDGKARPAKPGALAETFRLLNDNVRCVLLNACYSERQAKAIAKHIETVIGMSDAIADSDAIAFSRAFYEALGFGKSVRHAFDLARVGIKLAGLSGGDLPHLHCRARVNPAKSFLV